MALPHKHLENEEVLEKMPQVEDFKTVSALFKQLSDPVRLKIFYILCHAEECVINLAAIMEMSSPAVAHHLRLLKDSGLVVGSRRQKEVFYKADDTEAAQALHHMLEEMMEISCPGKLPKHEDYQAQAKYI